MEGALRMLSLARWLGPWASVRRRPAFIEDSVIFTPDRRVPVRIYRPRVPIKGAFMISTGLHPMGHLEPRVDRLARVLCSLGNIVALPGYPDYRAMRLEPRVLTDARASFEVLMGQIETRHTPVKVFSISFGSAPALRLACDPELEGRIELVITLGGAADFIEISRKAMGEPAAGIPPANPIILPALFTNLVEHLTPDPAEARLLHRAWRKMCWILWGRPRSVLEDRWEALADELATELPESVLPTFYTGVGLNTEGMASALQTIDAVEPRLRLMDGRPHFDQLHCPVRFLHGVDDLVVGADQSLALDRAVPVGKDHELHLTGLFHHSGTSTRSMPISAMAREARTWLRVFGMMAGQK